MYMMDIKHPARLIRVRVGISLLKYPNIPTKIKAPSKIRLLKYKSLRIIAFIGSPFHGWYRS